MGGDRFVRYGAAADPGHSRPRATTAMVFLAGASLVGLSSANTLVILQNCAPVGEVGAWAGAANFIGNLGGVLSPLVAGVLISRTGGYFPGFAVATVVLIAGVLPYWLLVGDLKPRGEPVRSSASSFVILSADLSGRRISVVALSVLQLLESCRDFRCHEK